MLTLPIYIAVFFIVMSVARSRGRRAPTWGFFAVGCAILAPEIEGILELLLVPGDSTLHDPLRSDPVTGVLGPIFTQLISIGATVMSLAGLLYALPVRDIRSTPKSTRVPYRLLGIGVIVVGFAFASIGIWARAQEPRPGSSNAPALIFALTWLTSMGARECFRLARLARLAFADRVLMADARPSVLFLRSFETDKIAIPGIGRRKGLLTGWKFVASGIDLFLKSEVLRVVGPFIALGDPDDYLPSDGAARLYRSDERWRSEVALLANRGSRRRGRRRRLTGTRMGIGSAKTQRAPSQNFSSYPAQESPGALETGNVGEVRSSRK
jgi:hypothetical protein